MLLLASIAAVTDDSVDMCDSALFLQRWEGTDIAFVDWMYKEFKTCHSYLLCLNNR